MKLHRRLLLSALLLLWAAGAAQAAPYADRFRYERAGPATFGPELSIDLFGTYATRDRFNNSGDHWGGGVGVNYFLTRYIGIGADSYLEEWHTPYRANGSLILRLPSDAWGAPGFAPYAFGGAGRQWKWLPQWTYHVGGGVEFRLNPHTGIFADGRRVFSDKGEAYAKDYALWRAGLRLSF